MAVKREINKGLRYLFPDGVPGTDWELDDQGAGPFIAIWRRAEPQPTNAQIDTAITAAIAAEQQAATDAQQARQALIAIAQGAVGVAVADWTAAQVRAIVGIIAWQLGGVDKDTKLRPLAQWVRDRSA